jgi:hypothetical protein
VRVANKPALPAFVKCTYMLRSSWETRMLMPSMMASNRFGSWVLRYFKRRRRVATIFRRPRAVIQIKCGRTRVVKSVCSTSEHALPHCNSPAGEHRLGAWHSHSRNSC